MIAKGSALAGVSVLLAAIGAFALQGCSKPHDDAQSREIAARVKTEMLHAWKNYERYAWGHDALKPLSKAPHDWYGQSLLMTPVDALRHAHPYEGLRRGGQGAVSNPAETGTLLLEFGTASRTWPVRRLTKT